MTQICGKSANWSTTVIALMLFVLLFFFRHRCFVKVVLWPADIAFDI